MKSAKYYNDTINEIIASTLGCGLENVQPEKHLCYDLLADSMDLIDIMINVEMKFGFNIDEEVLSRIEYVNELHRLVASRVHAE